MRFGPLPLLAACLYAACHPDTRDACARLADAASSCAIAHGTSASVYDLDAACADWDDAHEAHYGEYYACRAAAYEGADCSTDEGYAAALVADACCPPPGATASSADECAAQP